MVGVGAVLPAAGFVTVKENMTSFPANSVCPDATVRINFLFVSSQTPVNFAASASPRVMLPAAALAPESAVIVTTEEAAFARSTFGLSVTVNVLVALGWGVLWPIFFVVNVGTTTRIGFAPNDTPSRFVPGTVIAVVPIVAEPDAAMLIVAASRFAFPDATVGFTTLKVNTKSSPAASFCPNLTVRVSDVLDQIPVNFVSAFVERLRGVAAVALVNPEIVSAEEAECVKSTIGLSVTVIVLVAPARGVLWPIFMVVKTATIFRGLAPPGTPSRFVPGTFILVCPIAGLVEAAVTCMVGVAAF